MDNKSAAVAAMLDTLDKFDIPPGEVEIRFSDGHVMVASFNHVSEKDLEEMQALRSKGIFSLFTKLFR